MSERLQPWIGVDLDGTLAEYEKFVHHTHIGKPIPLMVERVKGWLQEGKIVKIFTARVSPGHSESELKEVKEAIDVWTFLVFGQILPVTCNKDYEMVELWDDRAVQVEPNTGRIVQEVEYDRGYDDGYSYGVNSTGGE